MRKLEIYVCNGEEKQDYRLIAELGKKGIWKADRWGNIKELIRLPKPMEYTRLLMLLWEAKMGYFGGWHRIDNNLKMIGTKVLYKEEV